MKVTLRKAAIAASTFACAALFSLGWSEQGGVSLSISKAEAATHVHIYVTKGYAASAHYYTPVGLSWYAVRAYYFGGPWSGPGFSYAGWDDYAARSGIGCTPGTAIKGGDGIMYLCQ
jgi:alpha-glucuronidase